METLLKWMIWVCHHFRKNPYGLFSPLKMKVSRGVLWFDVITPISPLPQTLFTCSLDIQTLPEKVFGTKKTYPKHRTSKGIKTKDEIRNAICPNFCNKNPSISVIVVVGVRKQQQKRPTYVAVTHLLWVGPKRNPNS